MFPQSDRSQSIVECLWEAARRAGVEVRMGTRVEGIAPLAGGGWQVRVVHQEPLRADAVMVATGSSESVWTWLSDLGHQIVAPVPSLFTFQIKDARLQDLAGLSVPAAHASVTPATGAKRVQLETNGPALVTHWGMSGPAILRLSAWGARALHERGYRFDLKINWVGEIGEAEAISHFNVQKSTSGKKMVAAHPQWGLPSRLWQRLTTAAGVGAEQRWADLDKAAMTRLAAQITACTLPVKGKSTFKEEFVTAGGIALREVDFRTFESKLHPGLYFAGEVLDIDAITGGFNFQAAWTGGFIAGHAMAAR
jgi:predicted Rossmann fold flavoprotein